MNIKTKRKPVTLGEALKRTMKEHGISVKRLAKSTTIEKSTIKRIIKGYEQLTPSMACMIGKALGTSAELWLNIQHMEQLWDVNNGEYHYTLYCVSVISDKTGDQMIEKDVLKKYNAMTQEEKEAIRNAFMEKIIANKIVEKPIRLEPEFYDRIYSEIE